MTILYICSAIGVDMRFILLWKSGVRCPDTASDADTMKKKTACAVFKYSLCKLILLIDQDHNIINTHLRKIETLAGVTQNQ